MSDLGFFISFFLVIVFLAITVGDDERGIFSDLATSTPTYQTDRGVSYSNGSSPTQPSVPALTPEETEGKVASIYRELDTLRDDLRAARLREPVSPYRDLVTLSTGNVYSTDPDTEYIQLSTRNSAGASMNISKWYLESYVTERSVSLPDGARLLTRWRSPAIADIVLLPGETAYLISGEAPLGASFKENLCTGYLNDEETFYPSLSERCPYPMDELEQYEGIELDNDRCYDFVEQLSSCTEPEDYSQSGNACRTFIEQTFNYNDCVRLHRYDPYFSRDGYWRVYLDRDHELWRSEREIIRLMDENNRVVSVLEY